MINININNNVFITGKSGIGKTYFIKAQILKEIQSKYPDVLGMNIEPDGDVSFAGENGKLYAGTVYITASKIQSLSKRFGKDYIEIISRLESVKRLIIDDFGVSKGSDYNPDLILSILDERENADLPTIVISNIPIAEIMEKIDTRIGSRLSAFYQMADKMIGEYDRRPANKDISNIILQ